MTSRCEPLDVSWFLNKTRDVQAALTAPVRASFDGAAATKSKQLPWEPSSEVVDIKMSSNKHPVL